MTTTSREDRHTATVEAAAAHAFRLNEDDPHHPDCRCHPCIVDNFDPADEAGQ